MNFLLSGYYGFGNAGDEAVLAAILQSISAQKASARFTVTSGNPAQTVQCFNSATVPVSAIPRQAPRALLRAIRSCDAFISGGGSLLQDVTSLRNVVYYTALIRFAQVLRKPVMIYAQGIGPLRRPISQSLARAAAQSAHVVTVRDEESKSLLHRIGVTKPIEVTADPVWGLAPQAPKGSPLSERATESGRTWGVSLRPWEGYEYDPAKAPQIASGLRAAASVADARFRFVPMQDACDRPVMTHLAQIPRDVVINTSNLHPLEIMAQCGGCNAMVAMRLHALIFAAAQGVPCVAINYDPKVAALAEIIGAPLLQDLSSGEIARLPEAVASAQAMDATKLARLQAAARRNAELAVAL